MEPSGLGGIREHLQEQEECTGFVPWFGASSSCLALMASVVPQDGLTQNSSLASWYNQVSSSNQYQYFLPSSNSNADDQSFSMDGSRKYEEARPANERSAETEKLPMQHFEQQIESGYSSSEDDQRGSFGENYSGDESNVVRENQSLEHQIAGEYSSWEDDICPRTELHRRRARISHANSVFGSRCIAALHELISAGFFSFGKQGFKI